MPRHALSSEVLPDLDREFDELVDLPVPRLRERWRDLYRSEPPARMSRELLMQAVAYCLQQHAYGGLSPAMRMHLAQAAAAGRVAEGGSTANVKRRSAIDRAIRPGTRFLREWQGTTHEVTATADGRFTYRGTSYRSLSAIARAITGTRWSGPGFFGIDIQTERAGNG